MNESGTASYRLLLENVARLIDTGTTDEANRLSFGACLYPDVALRLGRDWVDQRTSFLRTPRLTEQLADLKARLMVEGGPPSNPRVSVGLGEGLIQLSPSAQLVVPMEVFNARWYLTGLPVVRGDGAAVLAATNRYVDDLVATLSRFGKDTAKANAALTEWLERDGAALKLTVRAANTLVGESRRQYELALKRLIALGFALMESEVGERLGRAFTSPRYPIVGIEDCDRYLQLVLQCAGYQSRFRDRDQLEEMADKVADEWLRAATIPDYKIALNSACQAAMTSYPELAAENCPHAGK